MNKKIFLSFLHFYFVFGANLVLLEDDIALIFENLPSYYVKNSTVPYNPVIRRKVERGPLPEKKATRSKKPKIEKIAFLDVHNLLLERFRQETGKPNAKNINYSLIDPKLIPEEYKDYVINSETIRNVWLFRDEILINNIHFLNEDRMADFQKNKKGPESIF